MKQVIIIHGGDSFSNHDDFINHLKNQTLRDPKGQGSDRWTKSLRDDLGDSFELFQPQMPNWNNAQYEEWKIWFERHFEHLNDGVVLVGWSLGGMFLLKYVSENQLPFSIGGMCIAASPAGDYEIEAEPGNDCLSFQFSLNSLNKILDVTNNVFLYHSKDDFVVPYEHALRLKEAVPEAELVTFEDRNHFLQPEFPELVEKIKEIASNN